MSAPGLTIEAAFTARPSRRYTLDLLEELWAGREALTPAEVAALEIEADDRLWFLLCMLDAEAWLNALLRAAARAAAAAAAALGAERAGEAAECAARAAEDAALAQATRGVDAGRDAALWAAACAAALRGESTSYADAAEADTELTIADIVAEAQAEAQQ